MKNTAVLISSPNKPLLPTRSKEEICAPNFYKLLNRNDSRIQKHILFYEYFHGDNGAGIGASHQTGWTALVAHLLQKLGE